MALQNLRIPGHRLSTVSPSPAKTLPDRDDVQGRSNHMEGFILIQFINPRVYRGR